jgi:hypothetical protein
MAAPVGAFVLRNALVTVDDVEYANQATKARLVPDVPIQTVRTLVPDGVVQDVDSAVWTFELTVLQINAATGLAKVLRDMAPGTEVEIVLQPRVGFSQPTATFTVMAVPAPFGGDQGAFMMAEMVLPVVGAPVFGTSAAS